MIEVEIKVPISGKDNLSFENVEAILASDGFLRYTQVKEKDVYYTSEYHDCRALDEALRVRTVEDCKTGKIASVITFKGKKLDKVSMSRPEFETEVGDAKVAGQIFEGIGFYPVPVVEKERTEYKKDNVTVCLDRVTDLGDFLELEMIVKAEGERESALAKLEEILGKFGLSMTDTVRTSYLSMIENKKRQGDAL